MNERIITKTSMYPQLHIKATLLTPERNLSLLVPCTHIAQNQLGAHGIGARVVGAAAGGQVEALLEELQAEPDTGISLPEMTEIVALLLA